MGGFHRYSHLSDSSGQTPVPGRLNVPESSIMSEKVTPEESEKGLSGQNRQKHGPNQGVEKRNGQKRRFRLTPEESDDQESTGEKRLPIYIGSGIKQCKSALFPRVSNSVISVKTPDLSRLNVSEKSRNTRFQKGPTASIVLIKTGQLFTGVAESSLSSGV